MAKNKVTVTGEKELKEKLKKIERAATNEIEQALVNSALFVERDAKINAPVDTGRMRSALNHNLENAGTNNPYSEVISPVEYSKYVEFGTSKQSAQPFLYPALKQNKNKILKELAKALKGGTGL